MKNLIRIVVIAGCAYGLSACTDYDTYNPGYYSSGGNVSTYQSDVTTGYNRDYYSPHKQQKYVSTQNVGGDYSSDGSSGGYSSSGSSSGGYSSSQNPAHQNVGGYTSG